MTLLTTQNCSIYLNNQLTQLTRYNNSIYRKDSDQMVKKIKSPSCGPSWCQNHLFQLNPMKTNLYYKKKLRLRFCPKLNRAYNTFERILPQLNLDGKHYTPLFLLDQEKKYYSQNDERVQGNHEKLIQRQMQDESYFSIYEPKHGGQKPYCSVCEKGFSDYLEHICSHDHKKNLQNSIFTRYLMQIQQNFKKQQNNSSSPQGINQQCQEAKFSVKEEEKINQKLGGQKINLFQKIKSLERPEIPIQHEEKLQMQHIDSMYVDMSTLKELDQIV